MRTHGTLVSWNEAHGCGGIRLSAGGAEVAVHAYAFPADGQRPRIGELLSFEIVADSDGTPRAVRVARPARRAADRARAATAPRRRRTVGVMLALALAIAVYAYLALRPHPHAAPPPAAIGADAPAGARFRCDGRTRCTQMTSCAEARHFLAHCPGTRMDGNRDGVPCERQWCR